MEKTIEEIIESVKKYGFSFVEKYRPEETTSSIANEIGRFIGTTHIVKTKPLKPLNENDSTPNTYSGVYGLGEFPLHTDLAHWLIPPRYFILRCIKGSDNVKTKIVKSSDIIDIFGELTLRRVLVKPRRPINGSLSILRILDIKQEEFLFRWDELFIVPASQSSKILFSNIHEKLKNINATEVRFMNYGDFMLIDNWRVIHGRSSVDEYDKNRNIERIYIG